MENLSSYTPTELLKLINDSKAEHEKLKQDIIDDTFRIDELEKRINENLALLDIQEKNYVELIEELSSRENAV